MKKNKPQPMPDKPVPELQEPALDWNKVQAYIEAKHNIQLRGYKEGFNDGTGNKQYRDFWHWIIDMHEINRGCYFMLWRKLGVEEEWWVKEITEIIFTEFPSSDGYLRFWVDW